MSKYIIFLAILFAVACRPGAGSAPADAVDTTAVQADTLVADTTGTDTLLLND